jgi:choice-of-anchor A domain-containing protein
MARAGRTGIFRSALAAAAIVFGVASSALGDANLVVPRIKAAQKDLPATRFVADRGNVSIIEISGSYDADLPDGTTFNIVPRQALAREFYKSHPDTYDMVVVFTGFPIQMPGETFAFYHGVKNQVMGIGMDAFDNSSAYGSQGKLEGFIDMGSLAHHAANSFDKQFDFSVMAFTHEFMHQFGVHVKYRKPDGTVSDELLGQQHAHWSYVLDTSASVMYGARWHDNGDGTFTSAEIEQYYSPLDLYLMGIKKKEDVPPFFIIDAPGVDPTQIPHLGDTITGTRRNISIDDVISVEGPRSPSADVSQKDFRLAIIYAVRPGQAVGDAELAQIADIRRALATRFGAMTSGAANLNVYTEALTGNTTGTPANLPPSASLPITSVNLSLATSWLESKQKPDGSWSDTQPTAIRDSAVSALTVQTVDAAFSGLSAASAYLAGRVTSSVDFLARKLRSLTFLNKSALVTGASDLLSTQNADGGWGAAAGYSSNPLDTALAVQALLRRATPVDDAVTHAFSWLKSNQNTDGGWGNVAGGLSRTTTSAQVLLALQADPQGATAITSVKTFLAGRQNADGGFGDSPSSVHDTAHVVSALMAANATSAVHMDSAVQYLSVQQRANGSWDDSVYETALSLDVLARANAMNWAIVGLTATPASAADGQRVTLNTRITNTGNRNAPAGALRVYDGDPKAGGTPVGADATIPPLVSGASATVSVEWNTLGKSGSHTLFVVVDPDHAQQQLSIADDVATLAYTVGGAFSGAQFVVTATDIGVTPAHPTQLPATVTVNALLTNAGSADATNVKVTLWRGTGSTRERMADTTIATFKGRSTQPVSLQGTVTQAGNTTFTIEIDPDHAITGADETSAAASVVVSTAADIDLEVLPGDLSMDKASPRNGEDVVFSATIRNKGTVATSDFMARYSLVSGTTTIPLTTFTLHLGAGQQLVQTVPWHANQTGALTLKVELDPAATLAESNRTNNTATLAFTVGSDSGPSLSVNFKDLAATPNPALEGQPLAISALVRNVGDQSADNVEVAFYSGDPAQAGVQIGSTQVIASLAAGATQAVSIQWAAVPDSTTKLLFVVVDPANKIPADVVRDDNRAFITVPVKALADLAISTGNLTLVPPVPKPGDAVSLTARVDNIGQQDATSVLVRVYDGDPSAGGVQVGGDQVAATVPAAGSGSAHFQWTFSPAAGDHVLYVQVDPLQAVPEHVRTNNNAQLLVGVQSGDAVASTRYFSPNGDGVLDTVDFSFRLQSPMAVTIQVVSSSGVVVRRYNGPELASTNAARWTWDGKNDTGSVVDDDEYRLQAVDAAGNVVADAPVGSDTNRSSIMDALGTPYGYKTDLFCSVPNQNVVYGSMQVTDDGETAYFVVPTSYPYENSPLPPGFYSISVGGGDMRLITAGPLGNGYSNNAFVTSDGSQVVFLQGSGSQPISLYVANGLGGEPRQLLTQQYLGLAGLSADNSEALVIPASSNGSGLSLAAVSLATGHLRTIFAAPSPGLGVTGLSPDRRKATVQYYQPGVGYVDVLVDVATGAASQPLLSGQDVNWAPDSKMFEGGWYDNAGSHIGLFDPNGVLLRELQLNLQGKLHQIGWGHDSSEIFYVDGPGGGYDLPATLDAILYRLSTADGSTVEITRVPGGEIPQYEVPLTSGLTFAPIPGRNQVLVVKQAVNTALGKSVESAFAISTQSPYTAKSVSLADPSVVEGIAGNGFDGYYSNGPFSPASSGTFASFGRVLTYSMQGALSTGSDPSGGCFPHYNDWFTFRSLQNLTADLRAQRTDTYIKLQGTAADAHFASYSLEYATAANPTSWQAIGPVSTTQVIDGDLAQWAPPGPGAYFVRLTVTDLAGNQRQTIKSTSWGVNSLITNVSRSPEYISPNGDGVQDTTVIGYHVLYPVNIEFHIDDARGQRVRTFTRNESVFGVDRTIVWDGRNDAGVVVADGAYTLTFLDYQFSIKVDTTPPASADASPMARLDFRVVPLEFDDSTTGPTAATIPDWNTPHVRLDWNVTDTNFDRVVIEREDAANPDVWVPWLDTNRSNVRNPYDPTLIPLETAGHSRFRVRARDLAGNETVQVLALPEQVAIANRQVDKTQWKFPINGLFAMDDLSNGIVLEVAETVRAPTAQVAIEYQGPFPNELPEPPALPPTWSERILPLPTQAGPYAKPVQTTPEGDFVLAWDMKELTASGVFYFRVRITDTAGKVTWSAPVHVAKAVQFGVTGADFLSLTQLQVGAFEQLGQIVDHVDLLVQSADDPAYLTERVVWTRPGATTLDGLGSFGVTITDTFKTCATYNIRLAAYLPGVAQPLYSAVQQAKACNLIWTTLVPEVAASCGATPVGELHVRMVPQGRIYPDSPLVLLEFGHHRGDGTDDILFSKVNPAIGTTYSTDMFTGGLAEGLQAGYFARLTDAQNHKQEESVRVVVDRTPVAAKITSPVQGQRVCAVQVTQNDGTQTSYVPVEASITDAAGFDYVLSQAPGDSPVAWAEADTCALPYAQPFGDPLAPVGNSETVNVTCSVPPKPITALQGLAMQTVAGKARGLVGTSSIRLMARDWGGYLSCSTVSVFVDATVERRTPSIDRAAIAPGSGGPNDSATITYKPDEPLKLTALVYRKADLAFDPSTQRFLGTAAGAAPVRALANALDVLEGDATLVWDGRGDGGGYVEDGNYAVLLSYVDACAHTAFDTPLYVDVDRHPPEVSISVPSAGDTVSGVVDVRGSVSDTSLASYTLEYGAGSDPQSFAPIKNDTRTVSDAVLGNWNTVGLAPGDYTLRLRASDKIGNQAQATVAVKVKESGAIIAGIEATPGYISPNNDGVQDTAALRLTLSRDATVSIEIDRAGVRARGLVSAVPSTAGTLTYTWDGRDDAGKVVADGEYSVLASASTADGSTETVSITVVVDATAPAITLSTPAGGFARGIDSVIGSIVDANLTAYTALLRGLDSGTQVTFDQGNVARSGYAFGSLAGLPDGRYELDISANDRAGNTATQPFTFEIDNTPPQVALTAPANNVIVGMKASPLAASGTIVEKNLQRYRFNLAQGPPPGTDIATGTSVTGGTVQQAIDLSTLTDGAYTLSLIVDDKAGWSTTASTAFVVDKTAPVATITAPAEGSYLRVGSEVDGVATDANFKQFVIEIAPGPRASASRFTQLASGNAPVASGLLAKIAGLPPDGVQTLRLTVTDQAGNTSVALVQVTVDTTPPAVPQNPAAKVQNRQDVVFTWSPVTDSDLAGYIVYRDGVRITPSPITATTLTDPGVAEGDHQYSVSAIDNAGNESARSANALARISLSTPTAIITAPARNGTVGGLVDVRGSAYSDKDFKEFRLSVGLGTAPTSFTLLRRSTVPAQGESLGSWNSVGLPEGATYTLQLEAEDTFGSIGRDSVIVSVDNTPPARPVNLRATPSGSDVTLTWTPNTESDLDGYLLYRSSRLVNATSAVVGDLKPYVLHSTTYVDKSVPDGSYDYTVVAVDKAGNQSDPSAPAHVDLDTHAPHAVIVKPLNGAKVDKSTYVLASSDDNDIKQIQLQYRPSGVGDFINLGPAILSPPYGANWDLSALPYGNYDVQALATDKGGNTDPSPTPITITRAKLDHLSAPTGLSAKVDADTVTLNWSAVSSTDVAGYVVDRTGTDGTKQRITPSAIAATTLTDAPADGLWRYTVSAVDSAAVEGDTSSAASATLWTISVTQPYTPTDARTASFTGTGMPGLAVTVQVHQPRGDHTLNLAADGTGAFSIGTLDLDKGDNRVEAWQVDAAGNTSRHAKPHVMVGDRPSAPTGVAGTVSGRDATITWNANPEPDIAGYFVAINGMPDSSTASIDSAAASSEDPNSPASGAIDGYYWSGWAPAVGDTAPWIEAHLASPQLVTYISLQWDNGDAMPKVFQVEAWDGEVWVPLARVTPTDSFYELPLDDNPYLTDRIRVRVIAPGAQGVYLREIVMETDNTTSATTETFSMDGQYGFGVKAYNTLGLVSPVSDPGVMLNVGDTTPPDPVVLQGSVNQHQVTLTWTQSASSDVVAYVLFVNGAWTQWIDGATTLQLVLDYVPNGSYSYQIEAVDGSNLYSVPSNAVNLVVAVNPAPAPQSLVVTPAPKGGALDLAWSPPATGPPPASYGVERSDSPGAPFVEIASGITGTTYHDAGLNNGQTYTYRVYAYDANNETGLRSNAASGTPTITATAAVPQLLSPATPTHPVTLTVASETITGETDPGAIVSISINGQPAGTATALQSVSTTDSGVYMSGTLSPDGVFMVAFDGGNSATLYRVSPGNPSDAIQPLKTFPGLDSATWAADSRRFVASQSLNGPNGFTRRLVYVGLQDFVVHPVDAVQALSWSNYVLAPDGKSAYLTASDSSGNTLLYRVDIDGNTVAPAGTLPSGSYLFGTSPDGKSLAYQRSDQGVEIRDLGTGSTVRTIDPPVNAFAWAFDSRAVAYTRYAYATGMYQLYVDDGTGAPARKLSETSSYIAQPAFGPDGHSLAFPQNGALMVVDPSNGAAQPSWQVYTGNIQWVASGSLLLSNGSLTVVRPPGHFRLPDALFQLGDNRITATAAFPGGVSSAPSAAAIVTYSTADRPDLALSASDVLVLPSVPTINEATRISVTVRNVGPRDAASSAFTLQAIDPDGVVSVLMSARAPALASGASTTLVANWTPVKPGVHHLSAAIDTANEVVEASESNNVAVRDVTVVSTAAPTLAVATDAAVYPQNANVGITATVVNGGGATFNGTLTVGVEDLQGFSVSALGASPVSSLAFGQTTSVTRSWNDGVTLPGKYRVRAVLTDATGTVIAQATADFVIDLPVNGTVTVSTDRAQYAPGATVHVSGRATFTTSSAAGVTGDALISVLDDSGQARFESASTIALAGTVDVKADWPVLTGSDGNYTATFTVKQDGRLIGKASAPFTIGTPVLLPPVASITSPANNTVFGAPARITLQAGASSPNTGGSIAKVEFFNGTTKLGEALAAPYSFTWTSVPAGRYTITARATDDRGVTTDSAPVTVIVDAAPSVSITAPADQATFTEPANVTITVGGQDSDGAIVRVQVFQGALKIGECAAVPCTVTWNGVTAGRYAISAVATDDLGGQATSAPVTIVVSGATQPPVVAITSPAAGTVSNEPGHFTLVASASSPNSGGSIAKVEFLAGTIKLGETSTAPYTFEWTGVAAGTYSVYARATDNAGATSDSAPVQLIVNALPTAAVTAPADGSAYYAGIAVPVTVAASDADGTIATLDVLVDGTAAAHCTTNPCTASITGLALGTHAIVASATDDRGASAQSAPVHVVIQAAPLPPSVAITAPTAGAIVNAPGSIALAATASSPNAGGSIAKVEFFNGTTKVGESLSAPFTATWSSVPAGTYTVFARATDDRGITADSSGVSVIVNALPTVSITAPAANATFTAPADIAITATASDSDGTIAKIEIFEGATKVGECAASPCTLTFAQAAAGTYALTARATDNRAATATSAPVSVVVQSPLLPPTVSLTAPTAGTVVNAPAAVTVSANASSPNTGGSIAKVEFFAGATKIGESLASPYTISWSNVAAGSYSLTARATDDRGVTTTSAPVAIVVNAPPTVSITAPANNATYLAPVDIAITAAAADSDGTVVKVEIFQGATKLGECATSPCSATFAQAPAGNYALTARATDDRGATTTSAAVNVVVQAPQPPTVAITAPAAGTVVNAPGAFTVTASASSPNTGGSITKVEFFAGTTKIGEALTAPYTISWANVAAGTYSLMARATDNRGTTADSAPVSVIVNALPTVSITAPANNASYNAPADIAITATASDSDGTIAKIEIFQGATKVGECAASPCTVTFAHAGVGTYSLTAKATDNRGGATTSTPVSVTVKSASLPPTISITSPASGTVFSAPATIALTATASSPNTGGSIAKVEFFNGTAKLGEVLAAPYTFSWAGVAAGSYNVFARATDNAGATADSATVNVIVNALPTVTITAPAANAFFVAPATIAVTATASDTDGTIAKVEIFQGATKLGECATSPCTQTFAQAASGTYSFTARATDDRGGVTTSSAVSVTVGAVTGTITLTPASVVVGQAVQVSAQVTSPAALGTLPLKVRIYDPATNATVKQWTTTASVGAATPFTWAFTWDTTGVPAGSYKAALSESHTGTDNVLAQVPVTLTSAVTLKAALLTNARVLVLASCYQSSGSTDTVDIACAESRRTYIDQALTTLGITHRVVTDADVFRTEMRCGNWNVYWLAGGRQKLKDRMADEIAEEVYAGKGLLVDGVYDASQSSLDPVLGVTFVAPLDISHNYHVSAIDSLLPYAGFLTVGRAERFTAKTGTVVDARFDSAGADPAVTTTTYGAGNAVLAAFDLVRTQQSQSSVQNDVAALLAKAAPTARESGTPVSARVTLTNGPSAQSVTLTATLPPGVTLSSATPAPTTGTTWTLQLAANESRNVDLTLAVAADGTYAVSFTAGSATGSFGFSVAPISGGTHAAVVSSLNALNLTGAQKTARDAAVTLVNQSSASLASAPESALYSLLDAAKQVALITSPGDADDKLARLTVTTASATCQQVAACLRPDQGTPSLSSYQLMVFGDANLSSGSVEGAAAISGTASLSSESIASAWTGDSARLVVGGNLTYTNGSVGQNGTGSIRVGGTMSLTGVGRGSATSSATTENWSALKSYYQSLSTSLGALTGIAPVSGNNGTQFTLHGTDPVRNVFTLTAAQAGAARTLVFDVPSASTAIVNIPGGSVSLTNGQQMILQNGQQVAMSGSPFATRVLFNLPQAGSLAVSSWSIQGTVLAPQATFSFSNGQVFGQMFVSSLSSSSVGYQQCGVFKGTLP